MRKIVKLILIAIITCSLTPAIAGNYHVDDKAIDQLFATANVIALSDTGAEVPTIASANSSVVTGDRDPLVAIILDLVVGPLGIHRFYLGTETITGIGYILTCGGIFGIVPLVDLIVLAINYDDISMYIDNPAFFMW